MSVVKRIKKYLDFKGITNQKFEIEVGYSNGAFGSQLKNDKSIGSDKLENILNTYSEINPEWLLTGKGEMLKSKEPRTLYWRDNETGENIANKVNETPAFEINSDTIAQIRLEALHDKEKIIAMLEKDNKRLEKELQDQKRTIEQLKKELSLASNRKVGVKSDG